MKDLLFRLAEKGVVVHVVYNWRLWGKSYWKISVCFTVSSLNALLQKIAHL